MPDTGSCAMTVKRPSMAIFTVILMTEPAGSCPSSSELSIQNAAVVRHLG